MLRSRCHPLRRPAILCALLASVGCSAASPAASPPPEGPASIGIDTGPAQGGQTGSLIPTCEFAPGTSGGPLASRGGGVVFYPRDCPPGFDEQTLQLRNAEGDEIATVVEPLDTGAVLLQAAEPLEPGNYELEASGLDAVDLEVVESEGAPEGLGSVSWRGDICSAGFDLQLAPEMQPYVSRLGLSVSVDASPWVRWFDYGTLEIQDGAAILRLPACLTGCLAEGPHSLELRPELAGDDAPLAIITVPFERRCEADRPSGCSAQGASGGGLWLMLLAALSYAAHRGAGGGRRRPRRP